MSAFTFIVETDGVQHFLPIAFSSSQDLHKNLEKNRENDARKDWECASRGWPLLRVSPVCSSERVPCYFKEILFSSSRMMVARRKASSFQCGVKGEYN